MPEMPLQTVLFDSIDDAEDTWHHFADNKVCTPYQSLKWCRAYSANIAADTPETSLVAVGLLDHKPVVLLPLSFQKRYGIGLLTILGDNYANQNTGVWDAAYYQSAEPEDIGNWLTGVCKTIGADALTLKNIPENWLGRRHPFLQHTSLASPSPVFKRQVDSSFDQTFNATHSKKARKNLLRKQRNLETFGQLSFTRSSEPSEALPAVEVFLEQRQRRAQLTGIPSGFQEEPAMDFLRNLYGASDLQSSTDQPRFDVWTLKTDDIIRATCLCIEADRTLYAYSNSVASDETHSSSPGLVLIKELVSYACEHPDLDTLDLGLGEERYKSEWSDAHPVLDALVATTIKGRLCVAFQIWKTKIKHKIRNSGRAWSVVRQLRRWVAISR